MSLRKRRARGALSTKMAIDLNCIRVWIFLRWKIKRACVSPNCEWLMPMHIRSTRSAAGASGKEGEDRERVRASSFVWFCVTSSWKLFVHSLNVKLSNWITDEVVIVTNATRAYRTLDRCSVILVAGETWLIRELLLCDVYFCINFALPWNDNELYPWNLLLTRYSEIVFLYSWCWWWYLFQVFVVLKSILLSTLYIEKSVIGRTFPVIHRDRQASLYKVNKYLFDTKIK